MFLELKNNKNILVENHPYPLSGLISQNELRGQRHRFQRSAINIHVNIFIPIVNVKMYRYINNTRKFVVTIVVKQRLLFF